MSAVQDRSSRLKSGPGPLSSVRDRIRRLPHVGLRPHRDGGRILEVVGPGEGLWMLTLVFSPRHRNRWGQREPFSGSLVIYEDDGEID